MTKLKILFSIIALVVLMSAIVGCGALSGGAPAAPTAAPAAPTTGAAAPAAPTTAAPTTGAAAPGAPTTAAALPTVPFAATATQPVVAATDAPPRNSPTPPPAGTPNSTTLAGSAAPRCEAAFTNSLPSLQNLPAPESPFITMVNKEYEGRNWVIGDVTGIDASKVRSLLCVVETRKMTDKYPDGSPLYQVTWEARFLKWPEGNVLRVRAGMLGSQVFTISPKPTGTEFYGGRPQDQLNQFIKEAIGGG